MRHVSILSLSLFLASTVFASELPRYRAIPLEGSPGEHELWDVSNRYQVTGTIFADPVAVSWDSLGVVLSETGGVAYGLNDWGLLVGGYDIDGIVQPAYWWPGPTPQLGYSRYIVSVPFSGELFDVNGSGRAVGWASDSKDRAFTVEPGSQVPSYLNDFCGGCGLVPAYEHTYAEGLNENDVVVGSVRRGDLYAAYWESPGSRPTELPWSDNSYAIAVNDSNVVVGATYISLGQVWVPRIHAIGGITQPTLTGFGVAWDINNSGMVVGESESGACLWFEGVQYSLDSLIDPAQSVGHLAIAKGINDCGVIVATTSNGIPFLLAPDDSSLTEDTDLDGLPDRWEICGLDTDVNGRLEFTLDEADPNHKDLYLELDVVPGASLNTMGTQPLAMVRDAFARAPISNPDDSTGIHLHSSLPGFCDPCTNDHLPIDPDLAGLAESDPDAAIQRVRSIRREYWGYTYLRQHPDSVAMREALRRTHRYGVWARHYGQDNAPAGLAEINGNHFFIATNMLDGLGADFEADDLMHELGHTLGLGHGGVDNINFKPNYFSIMNYTWSGANSDAAIDEVDSPALENALDLFRSSYVLDYSRYALPVLDESQAWETKGIIPLDLSADPAPTPLDTLNNAFAGKYVPVGPRAGVRLLPNMVRMVGSVDWSRNEDILGWIAVDANCLLQFQGKEGELLPLYDAAENPLEESCREGQILESASDWLRLNYLPYKSPLWQDDASPSVVSSALVEESLTPAFLRARANMQFDCNGNGIADHVEIDSSWVADGNENGIPDPCELSPTTGVDDVRRSDRLHLLGIWPNPARGEATIAFAVPQATRVTMTVVDVAGRVVARVLDRELPPGVQSVRWNGTGISGQQAAAGVYFIRLQAAGYSDTERVILLR